MNFILQNTWDVTNDLTCCTTCTLDMPRIDTVGACRRFTKDSPFPSSQCCCGVFLLLSSLRDHCCCCHPPHHCRKVSFFVLRFRGVSSYLTTSKDLTGTGFGQHSSLGGLDVGNRHCSNSFQGGKVKKAFTIPHLVRRKRRMSSMLLLSNSTDQEKAIMVRSQCELNTTSAGGMALSRIASFQC